MRNFSCFLKKDGMNISILGCGWLGMPLGKYLVKKGFYIKGSSTDIDKLKEISECGVIASHIHFTPEISQNYSRDFFNTDLLFINIPPGRKNLDGNFYLNVMKNVRNLILKHKIPNIIFISSTSVYPYINKKVDENTSVSPEKESGKVLLQAEQIFLKNDSFDTNIIRFGGLIGGSRKPGRFLAGKKNISNANAPVNLIHLDDCIGIIANLIQSDSKGEIYNACMPEQPSKIDFYTKAAEKNGFPLPHFDLNSNEGYKIVDSSKIISKLKYSFKYKNPVDCL